MKKILPKSTGLAVAAILLGFTHSIAKDIEMSVETSSKNESKEIRISGQLFSQFGNGNFSDGMAGIDRKVDSDLAIGLRLGTGISWRHFMLALNAEYLTRNLDVSEAPVVDPSFPVSYETSQYEYQYLKLQPEFSLKMNVSENIEIGAITGIGFRTKIHTEKSENRFENSLSLGCYGQFRGINIRISEEIFIPNEGGHNSELSNTAIALGYSYSFQL